MIRNAASSALALVVLFGAPLVAAPALAPAVPWEGGASIGIEVKDQAGKPVVGAQVTLRFTEVKPPVGPPPLLTDAKGQAVAGHLAEGEWYVEVSHPQAMLYTAYLETRIGKAAKSSFAAQVSTGTSWAPLKVEFFKVKGVPPAAPAPVAAASAPPAGPAPVAPAPVVAAAPAPAVPAPVVTPPPVAAGPPPAAPAPVVAPTPVAPVRPPAAPAPVASTPPPPAPAATPRTTPAPAKSPPQPARPPASPAAPAAAPAPAPTPAAAATAAPAPSPARPPAAPAPTPAGAAPAPKPDATATPPTAAPRTAPAAPAPAAPASPPARVPAPPVAAAPPTPPAARAPASPAPAPPPAAAPVPAPPASASSGPAPSPPAAANLRSGESGTCPECGAGEWAATAEQVAAPLVAGVDCGAVASAIQPALAGLARSTPAAERGYAGPVEVPAASASGSCAVVAIVLPGDAHFVGYRYEAVDGWGGGDCVADQPCTVGQAHWQGHPSIERGERTVVWGVFVNASPERTRRARLTGYFRPGRRWVPPAR